MNKKHIKIGFIVFFIIFIIFVIVRKMNIDNNIQKQNTQKKPTKEKVQELKKEVDPRIKIKLEDTSSKTSSKIQELPISKTTKLENKKLTIKEIKNSEKTTLNIIKKEINTEKNVTPPKSILIQNQVIKNEKLAKPSNNLIKESKKINITSINDLKKIKNQIKINLSKKSFSFNNKEYKVNDKLGAFIIIKVEKKKIRFKKDKHLYYSLRFFS